MGRSEDMIKKQLGYKNNILPIKLRNLFK